MNDGRLKTDERGAHDNGVILDKNLLDGLDGPVYVAQRDGNMFRLAAVGDELVGVGEYGLGDLVKMPAVGSDAHRVKVIRQWRGVALTKDAEAIEGFPEHPVPEVL